MSKGTSSFGTPGILSDGLRFHSYSGDGRAAPYFFHARPDRHFYGHGVFSSDGRLLYTSENDFENGLGVIGVRDTTNGYRQIGEFSSYGIGPHDITLLGDGTTLVVANGGIETSPETGRRILNLAEMSPSLVYIDCNNGDLIEKHSLSADLHQLSIRHLTVTSNDRVVFGCQHKGPLGERPALMGYHDRGGKLQMRYAQPTVHHAMQNYVGSVEVDRSSEIIAASSPRGNLVTFWRAGDLSYLGQQRIKDGCGIAAVAGNSQFLLTSGEGEIAISGAKAETIRHMIKNSQFDNHAKRVR